MTPGGAGAVALAAVLTLGACGTTYLDSSVTVPGTGPTTTTTLPPVAADAPLDDVLAEIDDHMRHLDTAIVEQTKPDQSLARIDELWVVAEEQIRADDPNELFPFQQAIDLARSAVERQRPADASKGYKLMTAAIAAYAT